MIDSSIDIPYNKNITVASNELFLRATINRNLEKLLANDLYLRNKISEYGTDSEFAIQAYKENKVYNKGDVVVYPEYDSGKTKILNIYLLECTIDSNDAVPEYEIIDGFVKDFSKSGWKDTNPFFAIYNSFDDSINLSSFLENAISSKLYLSHETDLSYHKFGELHNDKDLSSKILLNDFSNIADFRKSMFWAYETGKAIGSNFNGVYKKWGNGVLEYDLTFSLGGEDQIEKTIDESGSIKSTKYIRVNSLVPLSSPEFNNDNYFLNEASYTIFNKLGSSDKYYFGGFAQTNVNQQVNTYHGTIEFPIPFVDEQYMVFASGTSLDDGRSQSPNAITFTNRQKQSITAVYVIPNYNCIDDVSKVLLKNNTFQCQIIGRWK